MYISFRAFSISRLKFRQAFAFPFPRSFSGQARMRVLNVAEKSDAAKNIAALLSGGTATWREGFSTRNKIYEFECEIFGQNSKMIMTSVTGHLTQLEFADQFKSWKECNPISLFDAPLKVITISDCIQIKRTLEREIRSCSKLIIWTDCDREGENIGFEIINVCKSVARNIEIYRAKFSEITTQSVKRAIRNLERPNEYVSNAVEVRKELDLRIGAAFTRFQTLYLQKVFPNALNKNLISYGSCQFPTLGFVVERFKAISEFQAETFWQINVQHTVNELTVDFQWKRNRLFNKLACQVLFDKCAESGTAKVENVTSKPKSKWRPKPLDTTALQKLVSRQFKINAKETLRVAENLYTQGLISYPRTETNFFSKEINLVPLVQCQVNDSQWGEFAQRVLRDGPNPFQGNKSDQAHPPIHPIKYTRALKGVESTIYEFIVRHFLACLSKHAEGLETIVEIDVAGEKFAAKGLMVTAKNYLEVYPYEKWNDKEINIYRKGEIFKPEIVMEEGETTPPDLLTEADLIGLMEKHGIGTDSTHAEHIETIKARLYVGLQDNKYFVPRTLGMGLVEGYNNMGYGMAKPELRAELEADLKKISQNQKSPAEVLERYIEKYRKVYEEVQKQMVQLSEAIQNYIEVEPVPIENSYFAEDNCKTLGKCPSCHSALVLKKEINGVKVISCSASPQCRIALRLPAFVLDVSVTKESCPTCGPNTHLFRFKFKKNSCSLPQDYVGCIGGCDWNLLQTLNFNASISEINTNPTRSQSIEMTVPSNLNESGFVSLNENSSGLSLNSSLPKCYCGVPAICLTSKKSGPNQGKEFYKCNAPRGFPKCDFFQWKITNSSKNTTTNRNVAVDNGEDMRCYCSIPCRRMTTMKEGPNKGRVFYACGKSFRDPDKCHFFKWADNEENRNSRKNIELIDQRQTGGREGKAWGSMNGSRSRNKKMWTLWSLRS